MAGRRALQESPANALRRAVDAHREMVTGTAPAPELVELEAERQEPSTRQRAARSQRRGAGGKFA